MVKLHSFAVTHINEGPAMESSGANTAVNTLTLQMSTPINGCTYDKKDEICARKLTYFALIGQHLILDFDSGRKCGETPGGASGLGLKRIWLQDAKVTDKQLPNNLVCGGDRKQVTHVRLEGLTNVKQIFPLSRDWARLKSLEVIRSTLESIPTGVGQLPNLIKLVVEASTSSALKTWLPSTISSLTRLKTLHLELTQTGSEDQNVISDAIFRKMSSLTSLKLQLTLRKLPTSICNLTNLESATFIGNPITILPDCFTELHQLSRLDVSNTDLTELPYFMDKFSKLKELNVERTSLMSIPPSLSNLTLTTFGLFGVRGLVIPKKQKHPICLARDKYRTPDRSSCTIFGDNTFLFDCQPPLASCQCGSPIPNNADSKLLCSGASIETKTLQQSGTAAGGRTRTAARGKQSGRKPAAARGKQSGTSAGGRTTAAARGKQSGTAAGDRTTAAARGKQSGRTTAAARGKQSGTAADDRTTAAARGRGGRGR